MHKAGCFLVAAVLVLGGCASSGPRHAEIKSTLPALGAEQARIFFYRNASPLGAAIQPDIRLNGEVVGTSIPGGFFYKDVAAGNYVVSTTTERERQLTFTIAAKDIRYVRTTPSFGVFVGRIQPELVPAQEAEQEIADLHYTPHKPDNKK